MEISGVNSSSYALYSPYDISADESLVINDNNNFNNTINEEGGIQPVGGAEPTATAVAINPIPQESIELRELQDNVISAFDDLRSGEISREEFTSSLEEFGIVNTQGQNAEQVQEEEPTSNETQEELTTSSQTQEEQDILDLASAFIETVNNSSQGEEADLSEYASLFDRINQETQSSEVNEQLQSYTQNLRY